MQQYENTPGGFRPSGYGQQPPRIQSSESVDLSWRKPDGMAGLGLVNFLLRIVTLGIHQFWGKAEVRRRLWSGIRINDEPLTYSGTGWELFRGFLLALLMFFLPLFISAFAIQIMAGQNPGVAAGLLSLLYIPAGFLVFVGIYTGQRYRLSRTEWRGIRGSLDGSAWGYAWSCVWTGILLFFTLGWIAPWRSTFLHRKLVNNVRFGNRPFSFDATSGPLYGRFALLWFFGLILFAAFGGVMYGIMAASGALPQPGQTTPPDPKKMQALTFAIVAAEFGFIFIYLLGASWYSAFKFNHFANHTHFEGAKFSSKLTGLGLIWQLISNGFIAFATLGILAPVALSRGLGYRISNTRLAGNVPVEAIVQSGAAQSTAGEGLAQLFDIDVF